MRLSILGLVKGVGKQEEKTTDNSKTEKNYRSQVVITYVEGVSERVDQVLKKYSHASPRNPEMYINIPKGQSRTGRTSLHMIDREIV